MSAPEGKKKRNRPQHLGTVVGTSRVSDHLVRVTLAVESEAFEPKDSVTDSYVKLLFADPALQLIPPFDVDALREAHGPAGVPVTRTYTIRAARPRSEGGWEIDLDFVTHGESGLAGPWAAAAQVGDVLAFHGPGGAYAPRPGAWHLLGGDEAALPAIAAALEAMGPNEVGVAVLDVAGPGDHIEIAAPAGVELRWLERGGEWTPESTTLADGVAEVEIPSGADAQVFVHGERESMKDLRRLLMEKHGLDRKQMSLSAYWAYGRAEDEFQAEKRTPIGKIFPEDA